jgi:hypothetical protein
MTAIATAITVAVLLLVVLAVAGQSSRDAVTELQHPQPVHEPQPPTPSLPRLRYVPTQQHLVHEWLPMSPDQRAAETDQLRALWDASPDADVRTDLRADPGPHEPA